VNNLISLDNGDFCVTPDRDRNPALVYLASLAPTGRRTTAGRLTMIARDIMGIADPESVPWHQLRYQHVAAIRTKLQELGYSPATINGALYAIRGVARAAFNLELMDAENYQRIRDVRPIKADRLPAGRALTPGELAALMDACAADAGPAGIRDAAIIGLLYCGGLRRAEAAALKSGDYNAETGELLVLGKGNKQRNVWIDNGAADALADWLAVRGGDGQNLFLAINKGGRILPQGMTDQAIYNLLRKRAKAAGVRDCSCHDLRRSYISDLLDAGADIATVAKLAGHSQVQTSARYDRRGEVAKRKAVALLHLPYRRRQALWKDGETAGGGNPLED
jgi:site-specific recombinase XerD